MYFTFIIHQNINVTSLRHRGDLFYTLNFNFFRKRVPIPHFVYFTYKAKIIVVELKILNANHSYSRIMPWFI